MKDSNVDVYPGLPQKHDGKKQSHKVGFIFCSKLPVLKLKKILQSKLEYITLNSVNFKFVFHVIVFMLISS